MTTLDRRETSRCVPGYRPYVRTRPVCMYIFCMYIFIRALRADVGCRRSSSANSRRAPTDTHTHTLSRKREKGAENWPLMRDGPQIPPYHPNYAAPENTGPNGPKQIPKKQNGRRTPSVAQSNDTNRVGARRLKDLKKNKESERALALSRVGVSRA